MATQAPMNPKLRRAKETFPSSVVGTAGKPVVVYDSEEDRDRGDRIYKCRVVNSQLGLDSGQDSVSVNGRMTKFELGAEIELRGFEIDTMRQCKYTIPNTHINDDGNMTMKGVRAVNVYNIDVQF